MSANLPLMNQPLCTGVYKFNGIFNTNNVSPTLAIQQVHYRGLSRLLPLPVLPTNKAKPFGDQPTNAMPTRPADFAQQFAGRGGLAE